MFHLIEKKGYVINPNQKAVSTITTLIERNGGKCPCTSNTSEDTHCPCTDFREKGVCCCHLYVKEDEVHTSGEVQTKTTDI